MKTHMSNTEAFKLTYDVVGHQHFLNHQRALHSNIKPAIDNKRKQQIKIVKNHKVQLNSNPKQHVNKLYTNIFSKVHKSTIDNKVKDYDSMKGILADKLKKNKFQKFAQSEHQREIKSMKKRVENCKNLQQRKKDNCDPITNPTYFIKHGKDANSVTIDNYCKKILGMNRPQSGVPAQGKTQKQFNLSGGNAELQYQKPNAAYGTVPNFSKQRPQSATHQNKSVGLGHSDDLPVCTFKEILNHIVNNKLFRDVEMKVLYVRLCHRYGDQAVDGIWQDLMDELER